LRAELIQVIQSGGFKGRTGIGSFTNTLKEGDFIRAEVLSSEKGSVALKMPTGHVINAKVDVNATFSPGDKVMLEVTGKENDVALLSILREDEVLETGTPGQKNQMGSFEDKSLAPYASKLQELNMPVREETARAMRDLITQNPKMSLDEAAFLVSNKLTGSDAMMKAALAMLNSGEKTDAMLQKLIDLLSASNIGTGAAIPESGAGGKPANTTPLMELFTQINDSVQVLKGAGDGAGQVAGQPTAPIITHTDTILQSRNAISDKNIFENAQTPSKQAVSESQSMQINMAKPDIIQPSESNQPKIVNQMFTNTGTQESVQSGLQANPVNPAVTENINVPMSPVSADPASTAGTAAQSGVASGAQTGAAESPLTTLHSQLTSLLSELPEFRQTPSETLERFTSSLLRVAGDTPEINAGDTDKLKMLIDKMFTRIQGNDLDAGDRLRSARQELFTRLSLIEEAIMRASPGARAEMIEQTQKVMEHVRILNNIDQFVYMQLPVTLGDERKSAELYLFKKKGGKRVDPDNVNILLAIDLQHMGHWEALLNIRNREVSVKMDVPGVSEKDFFSAHTVLLHNMLAEADFKLVNTNISYADEDEQVTPLTALNALDRYTTSNIKKIDFVI